MPNNNSKVRKSPKIVGSGLVTLDIITNNGAEIPIFSAGGTCGNILAGLSYLGWESISISRAGNDIAADLLVRDLLKNGVNVEYITREENLNTPRIVEKLDSNGIYAKHNFLLRCPACNAYLPRFRSPKLDVIDDILSKHLNPDVYLFDRITPSILKLAKNYRDAGSLIFFEPINLKSSDALEKAIRLSHVIKYAGKEAKENIINLNNDPFIGQTRSLGPKLIIQTLGKYGLLFKKGREKKYKYRESIKLNEVYDTCGAGDWCTVGFLFYLRELAEKNNISFLETLKSNDVINSALHFAQILAALSCMFVGARGLSNLMARNDINKIVRSYEKMNDKFKIAFKKGWKSNSSTLIPTQNIDNDACNTCLLPK